jgi:AraC family transcriptional regulator of adaptative response/methylated-DNA-[protein]-cysteine methyltransferase
MSQPQSTSRGAADPVETVRALCRHIEAHPDEPTTLAALGRRAELSPAHLQRVFKRVTGLTPRQYADACRLGLLKERLKQRETVTVAMYEAGYGSSSRLYERAAGQLGMTPATYQRGGRAVRIAFTVADSPLGRLLLAATERGVCMVSLGDADAPLEAALFAEYPAAAGFDRDEERLRPWLDQLLEHLRGERPHIDLPLDVQATAFRWRVWQELSKIPAGETRSYAEIARAVGQPAAVRAVGSACGANPVAVVIPCHRAIRTDGGLGGYRWGLDKKRALLKREQP